MSLARLLRIAAVVVLIIVGPAVFRTAGLPLLNDRLSLAAAEHRESAIRARNNKDDEKKAEANAEKRSEQEGNPRNRDKPPRGQDNQSEREVETNNLGDDAFQIEGLVLATLCKRNPKEVIIGSIDGDVTLRMHPRRFRDGFLWEGDVRCDDLVPGDYIYVHEAQKVHEYLYDVYEIRCQKDDTGSGTENDNDDTPIDEEDSCPHNPPPPELQGHGPSWAPGGAVMRLSTVARFGPGVQALSLERRSLPVRQDADDSIANENSATDDTIVNEDSETDDTITNENSATDETETDTPETSSDNESEEWQLPPGWREVSIPEGEAATLTSEDGRVALSVREGHMPGWLLLTYADLDALEYPPTPGPNVGALFELTGWTDDGPAGDLPGGVNLGVHYTPRYATGVDETRLTIGVLETDAGGWVDVPSIADPDNKYVSATISRVGIYAAYERPRSDR